MIEGVEALPEKVEEVEAGNEVEEEAELEHRNAED